MTRGSTRSALLLASIVLAVTAACGSSATPVSAAAASQLGPQVEAVRQAALRQDPVAALALLAQLRTLVARLQAAHQISASRAAATLAAAAEVQAQLDVLPTTTTVTPETKPPPDHGHGHDHGGDQGPGGDGG